MSERMPVENMKMLHLSVLHEGGAAHIFALKEHEPGLAMYVLGMAGFIQEYLAEAGVAPALIERVLGDVLMCSSVVIKAMERTCGISLMPAQATGNTTAPSTPPQSTRPEAQHE